ncbi:DMT family transporter [Streptomyces sp. NRRL S-337]|uniref:DMT family transporter n=1 Tax=Streptomyces sp. NRRL S-337 TaxID=1463900 RepID=UPI00055C6E67|nr:DMT family transporter [Streptomyces sp. NRRL S-337]
MQLNATDGLETMERPAGDVTASRPDANPGGGRGPTSRGRDLLTRVALVAVWSSGFISGKLGLQHSAPYTFATLRFAIAGSALLAIALARRAAWPGWRLTGHLAITGILVQAVQFSSIYVGMDLGVPSGLAALIIALYPLAASLLAVPFLHERVTRGQYLGLVLGLGGVALAVAGNIHLNGDYVVGLGFLVLALAGISAGTVYQKRFCRGMEPVTGNAVQLLAAAAVSLPFALFAEGFAVAFTADYWPVLLWAALVNSIVGVGLLYTLLQRHGTSQVSSLFYLVPMATAGLGALALDQHLSPLMLAGLILATAGTLLANRIRT